MVHHVAAFYIAFTCRAPPAGLTERSESSFAADMGIVMTDTKALPGHGVHGVQFTVFSHGVHPDFTGRFPTSGQKSRKGLNDTGPGS